MHLALTDEQVRLQQELRTYFVDLVDEVEPVAGDQPAYLRFVSRMGEDGWLGLGWPVEYGGQARGPVDQMIFVEESHWAGVPLPLLTLNSVGPTLMAARAPRSRRSASCPGILRGEVHFSIGYTEPSAGTDLASLQTRAVRDGDEYVINGEKLYTSAIQYADYVWLAARTDPDAPKHKGLSVFIVPTDAPGFRWTPLRTMAGEFTSATYYDGRPGAGRQPGRRGERGMEAHHQPAQPRAGGHLPGVGHPAQHRRGAGLGPAERLADGRRVIDQEWVRVHLARLRARAEYLEAPQLEGGVGRRQGPQPGGRLGDQGLRQRVRPRGLPPTARDRGPGRLPARRIPGLRSCAGRLERNSRSQTIFTFGGGTNEIQRDIIAMVGLGMPRAPR